MGETETFDREAKGMLQNRVARTGSSKGLVHPCKSIWPHVA